MLRRVLPIAVAAAFGFTAGSRAIAVPFIPTDAKAIVETLRERPLDRSDIEFRVLRRQLRLAPASLPVALAVAQTAIEIARRDGDPRYLGYAESALAPWWVAARAPISVQLLKATLLQSVHRFDDALVELRRILESDPRNAQAWLLQASILQVQGRYAEAASSCERLAPLGAGLYGEACLAELGSLTGNAAVGHVRLTKLIVASRASVNGWLHLVDAELEERQGEFAIAEREFRLALALSPDAYTKGAFADFLLDRGRPAEVVPLLVQDKRADPLLLRLTLAYQALGAADLADGRAALTARFAAARLRGDKVHLREEARFELHLLAQADEALGLALANWRVQREPADARILLEAAQAAHQPSAADSVRQFVRQSGLSDQRLAALLK